MVFAFNLDDSVVHQLATDGQCINECFAIIPNSIPVSTLHFKIIILDNPVISIPQCMQVSIWSIESLVVGVTPGKAESFG